MPMFASRYRFSTAVCALALLSGCAATTQKAVSDKDADPYAAAFHGCMAAAPDDAAVGNWLSVRKESGIPGEMRVQIVLQADGGMRYVEQLKRGNRPPQSLDETGCWYREDEALVLRTTASNSSPVDAGDPIYINRYAVTALAAKGMTLNMHGKAIQLRRASPDYRLPIL